MSEAVQVAPVRTRGEREQFLGFAEEIYRDWPAWVPPLRFDQRRLIDPKRGDFFRSNAAEFFLARRGGKIVGRIAAFQNNAHLAVHPDGAGFFGFFECRDDIEVARALLDRAEAWLRERGLKVSRGPANFSIFEEAGVLLDGFEHAPMMGMTYTPPYYRTLLEAAGYAKAKDMYVYRIARGEQRMDQLKRIVAAAERQGGITVRPVRMNRLREEAEFLALVFREAWQENWGSVPITQQEFQEAYERYRLFIVPELVFLAEVAGEPAGFFVAMPDMNQILARMGGRLLPTGIFRLLFGRGKINRYRVFLMGVRPKFRRLGIPLVFITRCGTELLRRNFATVEFSWVLEDNVETIAVIERIGGRRAQTLRLYEKPLA